MKRFAVIVLLLLMLISLCGCGSNPEQTDEWVFSGSIPDVDGFQVGFARVDITPTESVPISGLGRTWNRMSTSVHDTLYTTCIALTDAEGETILMFTIDTQHTYSYVFDDCRALISAKTGIPQDHIFQTATHTHSGPDISWTTSTECVFRYREQIVAQTVEAAYAAILDRKPATMAYGHVEAEGMNFVKHYKTLNSEGVYQYFGDSFGTEIINETTTHTTEVYDTMHILEFQREGGKNIVLANWRSHPHLFTSATSYKLSADFIGAFRTAMEDLYDCHFAYFQGAAGNINSSSRIDSENKVVDQDYGQYGYYMAQYCLTALENMTPATGTDIKTLQVKQELEARHDEDYMVGVAAQVQAVWNSGGTKAQAMAAAEGFPINSPYHANYIIANAKRGDTVISELNAFSIGDDIAVVTAPHELFDSNSRYVEENSPFAFTMTYGYTNGANSYVPSAFAWEHGCYECDASYTAIGSGEIIQDQFLKMLTSLE